MSSLPVETVAGLALIGVFAIVTPPVYGLFRAAPPWIRDTARGDLVLIGYALVLLAGLVLLVHGLV